MANAARQEVELKFGERTFDIKPTFEIVANIELTTGYACTALADKFFAADPQNWPSLTLTGQVLNVILRTIDPKITGADISQTLMDYGCDSVWQPLGRFCSRALKGNKEHMRRAEEEAARLAAEGGAGKAQSDPPQAA